MAAAEPIGNSRNTDVTAKGAAVKVLYEGTWCVSVSFTVHLFVFTFQLTPTAQTPYP